MIERFVCSLETCGMEYCRDTWNAESTKYCSRECSGVASILSWARKAAEGKRLGKTCRQIGVDMGVSYRAAERRLHRLPQYITRFPAVAEAVQETTASK